MKLSYYREDTEVALRWSDYAHSEKRFKEVVSMKISRWCVVKFERREYVKGGQIFYWSMVGGWVVVRNRC